MHAWYVQNDTSTLWYVSLLACIECRPDLVQRILEKCSHPEFLNAQASGVKVAHKFGHHLLCI
jgi:hypothetical protein